MRAVFFVIYLLGICSYSFNANASAVLASSRPLRPNRSIETASSPEIEKNTKYFQKIYGEYKRALEGKNRVDQFLLLKFGKKFKTVEEIKEKVPEDERQIAFFNIDDLDVKEIIGNCGLDDSVLFFSYTWVKELFAELVKDGYFDAALFVANLLFSFGEMATYKPVNFGSEWYEQHELLPQLINTPNLLDLVETSYPNAVLNLKSQVFFPYYSATESKSIEKIIETIGIRNTNPIWNCLSLAMSVDLFCAQFIEFLNTSVNNSLSDYIACFKRHVNSGTIETLQSWGEGVLDELCKKIVIKTPPLETSSTHTKEKSATLLSDYEKQSQKPGVVKTMMTFPKDGCSVQGIENIGNTCYFNSALQGIVCAFGDIFEGITIPEGVSSPRLRSFQLLSKILRTPKLGKVDIAPFVFNITEGTKAKEIAGLLIDQKCSSVDQEDSSICLFALLNGLNDEIDDLLRNSSVDDSFKSQLGNLKKAFLGKRIEHSECNCCKQVREIKNPFIPFNFSTEGILTSIKGIKFYSIKGQLDHFHKLVPVDELWCNKCNAYMTAVSHEHISELPEVFILSLARRIFDKVSQQLNLDKTPLRYEKILNVEWGKERKITSQYILMAEINYGGDGGFGHYTADVSDSNGNWYNISDLSVSKITKEYSSTSDSVCVLFYKKIS